MQEISYLDSPEYKKLGDEEKKIFKYALKRIDEKLIKAIYYNPETEMFKRYSLFSDGTKLMYINALINGEKPLEALDSVEKLSSEISDYTFKLGILIVFINLGLALVALISGGTNLFTSWSTYISIVIQLIIICGVTTIITKSLLKYVSYTKAKILGTICSFLFLGLVLYYLYTFS